MYANFLLGKLVIANEAKRSLRRVPYDLIARHAVNDHGLITPAERRSNLVALATLGEVVSRFRIDPTDPKRGTVLVKTAKLWRSTVVEVEPLHRVLPVAHRPLPGPG